MTTVHFKDLRFSVVAVIEEYAVQFSVYDIECLTLDDEPLWHRKDALTSQDAVENIEQAERYLHGYVKWDGCSNWHFDEQDRVMLHGCSREDLARFGEVMARCWDMTAGLLDTWNA